VRWQVVVAVISVMFYFVHKELDPIGNLKSFSINENTTE
jgi:hypothetical protein